MTRTLTVLAACLALGGGLIAGCGGDDEEDTAAGGAQATQEEQAPPAEDGGGEEATGGAEAGGDAVEVGMENIEFVPMQVTAAVGQTIRWTNNESAPHNVTSEEDGLFESETLMEGDTFEYTPEEAGEIAYVCTIHPGQDGTITVE
jgi:plastocyanin